MLALDLSAPSNIFNTSDKWGNDAVTLYLIFETELLSIDTKYNTFESII